MVPSKLQEPTFKGKYFRDFHLASLDEKSSKQGSTPKGANSFCLKVYPLLKGYKNKNGRAAFPESVSFHLTCRRWFARYVFYFCSVAIVTE